MKILLVTSFYLFFNLSSYGQQNAVFEYQNEKFSIEKSRNRNSKKKKRIKSYIVQKGEKLFKVDCFYAKDCYFSDSYTYQLQDSVIVYSYFQNDSTFVSHNQFSLTGDTLDYVEQEESHYSAKIMGQSFYVDDTSLAIRNRVYNCYYFRISNNPNFDSSLQVTFQSSVYINKSDLLPVYISTQYYDINNKHTGYKKMTLTKEIKRGNLYLKLIGKQSN